MNALNIIIIILLILFIIRRFLPVKGVKQIDTADLKDILHNGDIQFIDVRSNGEYNHKHIKAFKNIPLFTLKQEANHLDKMKEIVVICQSGQRSLQACRTLKKLGFEHITNVNGGMMTW